jgi:hypothetical protein
MNMPYTTDAAQSIEDVKNFAQFIASTLPGMYYDESLTTVTNNVCKAYVCMEDSNKPIICTFNYSTSTASNVYRGIGYSFVGLDGANLFSSSNSSVNSAYGQYWYRYSYNSINAFRIYYTTAIPGITLFNICSNAATNVNKAYNLILDHFISSVTVYGNEQPEHLTVFRYLNGTIGYSNSPFMLITNTSSFELPSNLYAPEKYYFSNDVRILGTNNIINGISMLSGLNNTNTEYCIIKSNSKRYITVGEYVPHKWLPIIDIT